MSGNNQKVGVLSDFQPQTDVYTEILVSSQKAKTYKCFLSEIPFKRSMFWPRLPPPLATGVNINLRVSRLDFGGTLSLLFISIPFLDSQQIKLKLSQSKVKDPYKKTMMARGERIVKLAPNNEGRSKSYSSTEGFCLIRRA
ncbi:hypothetical protein GDO78_003511 [Eleutherodactylus coqui]|uniref:Uncharacterized protein n=1 Tax=Eleutherodactylus coqui TaxID=57060 RepID=A0A8J6EUN3_ELECQ|nr:hypothetical protein GDO78_003511 [Eleutherodactylus coqui]